MKTISYEYFDCVICLDAELPDINVFEQLKNIPIFAADGAVFKLYELGVETSKIIGDLDTFDKSLNKNKITKSKIIRISEQDTNDFEKVLKYVIENNYKNCLILGINGGEYEHSLNNWSVFIKYNKKLNLCLYTENRYGITIDSDTKIKLELNEKVSLIPQPEAIITTKNLRFNLNNEMLSLGIREGARNYCIEANQEVIILVHKGELCMFFDARLPKAPVPVII